MSGCPVHQNKLRAELPPLTERIAALPVDERGYPVPFFVAWIGGKPEFRIADGPKWKACVQHQLCWCCGQRMGAYKTFPIGPMCALTRTTAEPPSHLDCAGWSVRGCPFLSKPQMTRREHEEMAKLAPGGAGIMIERNPGVTCLWTTKTFELFHDPRGKPLITVGEPLAISWWREGRAATRAEVMDAIESGLPILREHCQGPADEADLKRRLQATMRLLPKEAA